jgi:hypothetical protein
MTLQELEQIESELWQTIQESEWRMKPIRSEWASLRARIEKEKLREEVLREMGQDKQPG